MTVWLIQRIQHRTHNTAKNSGVDSYFSFDYMGASEFEWGALPEALKRMRESADQLNISRIRVEQQGDTFTAWAVCLPEDLDEVTALFRDQLHPNRSKRLWALKESTYISRSYQTDPFWGGRPGEIIGWWAIDSKVPWTFFMKKKDAHNWLKSLRSAKVGPGTC